MLKNKQLRIINTTVRTVPYTAVQNQKQWNSVKQWIEKALAIKPIICYIIYTKKKQPPTRG